MRVERLVLTANNGVPAYTWVAQGAPLDAVPCRLDLNFVRPGKDQLPALEAGRAPDRVGVLFCASEVALKAGDRVVTTKGPVTGTFEIRAIPDQAVAYASANHIEVQIIEVNQNLTGARTFPSLDE